MRIASTVISVLMSGALGLAIPRTLAQRAEDGSSHEYVVIDSPFDDHTIRRETTITRLGAPGAHTIRFHIVRKFYADPSLHYNTGGDMFDPPIFVGDIAIYPGRYSRLLGRDQKPSAESPRIMMFTEAVETVILGVPIEDKLGDEHPSANSTVDRTIEITPRTRTGAWLGMTGNNIAEHEVDRTREQIGHPELLVDLGNGKEGFIGTRVDSIDANGPASHAGIQPGDLILTLDSIRTDRDRKLESVTDYAQQGRTLTCLLMRMSAGKTVVLSVQVMPQSRASITNAP